MVTVLKPSPTVMGFLSPTPNVKKLYPKGILEKGHKASLHYFFTPPCSMKNNFVPPCVWLTVFRGLLKTSTNQKSQFRYSSYGFLRQIGPRKNLDFLFLFSFVPKSGVGVPFGIAIARRFKTFNWGWFFFKSTVLVGQAVSNPNWPNAGGLRLVASATSPPPNPHWSCPPRCARTALCSAPQRHFCTCGATQLGG